jgi:hypothetical protein
MALVGVLTDFVAGTTAVGADVKANDEALKAGINSITSDQIAAACLLDVTTHGDQSSWTSAAHSAESIIIDDTASQFTTDNVQAGIVELATFVGLTSGITERIYDDYAAATSTDCEVVVPANAAKTGIIVFGCTRAVNSVAGSAAQPLDMQVGANPYQALSATGAGEHPQFEVILGGSGVGATLSLVAIITAASTSYATHPFDKTAATRIRWGTKWDVSGTTTFDHFSLIAMPF